MKKLIVTLAIAICSLPVFAADVVNQKVLNAFNNEFTTAAEVQWSAGQDYFKASFLYNGKYVFAYYDYEGELLGLARNLSPVDLPIALQTNLKKNYEGYWVSDLFEVVKNDDTNYFITLENAETKLMLKSEGNGWSIFRKTSKS